jgi:sugar lactone lactonase YvrE
MKIIKSIPTQCVLAEGPLWSASEKAFYWVDIEGRKLFRYFLYTDKLEEWVLPGRVTSVSLGKDQKLILTIDRSVVRFDPTSSTYTQLSNIDEALPRNRCNDAKADSEGRLWIGTMCMEFTTGAGSLYRLDEDLSLHHVLEGLTIGNGMAWTEDQKVFYYIDSPQRRIDAFYYDTNRGTLVYDRVAVTIPEAMGMPDGMCIDEEGRLWVAHYGGSGVYCWDPMSGTLEGHLNLPALNITSCAFGGEQLDLMLVTTASQYLSAAQLTEYPESGNIFLVQMDTKGFLPNPVNL